MNARRTLTIIFLFFNQILYFTLISSTILFESEGEKREGGNSEGERVGDIEGKAND